MGARHEFTVVAIAMSLRWMPKPGVCLQASSSWSPGNSTLLSLLQGRVLKLGGCLRFSRIQAKVECPFLFLPSPCAEAGVSGGKWVAPTRPRLPPDTRIPVKVQLWPQT